MRIILACLLSFLILTLSSNWVWANTQFDFGEVSEGQIAETLQKTVPVRFLPSHPLYFLITFKETFNRLFQPSALKRSQFDLVLSGKRLKEAYQLLEQNNLSKASSSLARYSGRIDIMIAQLDKARMQNQDVVSIAGGIADTLKYHETLLVAINSKWQNKQDGVHFDENFANAVSSFKGAVVAIDNLKPGIKDRFVIKDDNEKEEVIQSPSPTPTGATPSGRPRRIIY